MKLHEVQQEMRRVHDKGTPYIGCSALEVEDIVEPIYLGGNNVAWPKRSTPGMRREWRAMMEVFGTECPAMLIPENAPGLEWFARVEAERRRKLRRAYWRQTLRWFVGLD